jgi:alpha-L-fucosidase 2
MKLLFAKTCLLAAFVTFLPQSSFSQAKKVPTDLKLWYDEPATDWMTQALPIGNGYMGVMFFGDPEEERLQFSEGSLWAGGKGANQEYNFGLRPEANKYLPEVRALLAQGKLKEAHRLANKELTGSIHNKKENTPASDFGAQQTMGDLFVSVSHDGAISHYKRELDIATAQGKVSYEAGGQKFERNFFGNYPSKVMVYRFTSTAPQTYTIRLTSPHQQRYQDFSGEGQYTFGGSLKDNGQEFETAYRIKTDGQITYNDGKVTVRGAKSVTLTHTAATDYVMKYPLYRGLDFKKANREVMARVSGKTFEQLLKEQYADYTRLFNRVSLWLGDTEGVNLPTNQRQKRYFEGQADPGLEVLYFQYGRYLMISASRPGTMPMSLQGKWNDSTNPPWANDYHTNINIQMIYWPAQVTDLAECYIPLSEFTKSIVEPGRLAAKAFFGTNGWVVNTMLNGYGYTSPGWDFPWGFFPGGAAWLSQHMWEQYAFTQDKNYLKNDAYPVIKEAALFWIDYLTEDGQGHLVSSPSYSPEHGGISSGASMDHQIAWDILTNAISAAKVLGTDAEFVKKATQTKAKILPPQIGRWGQLQEWKEDVDDSTSKHRHVSHLFALHPGKQISPALTPLEAQAARVSLLARGDDGTGWSLAWKVNFWARLRDGNHAYKLFKSVLRPVGDKGTNMSNGGGSYTNLLCAHPPFQLDGNMGSTAGVAEMLLQSQAGIIEILPALPDAWPTGSTEGLKARGNIRVNISWQKMALTSVIVRSPVAQKCVLQYGTKRVTLSLAANKAVTVPASRFQ